MLIALRCDQMSRRGLPPSTETRSAVARPNRVDRAEPAQLQSQRWESNPQPPHYECGALPIEATLAGASGRKRRTAETVKLAQMVTRRQVVRVFKGFCDRTAHKYLQTNTRAQNKKVGSRLGRSVLPKSSGSGARRPLDQKSRRPHFLRCGDGTRKNPADI